MQTTASTTPIDVRLMGPVQVDLDLGPETIPSQKVRSLLAILAINAGRTVPLPTILNELWGAEGLRNAKNACHATVSRLRRTLSGAANGLIVTSGSGYRLDIAACDVDIHRYAHMLQRALHLSEHAPEEAQALIDRGNELWRGAALEDVDDAPILNAERGRLREMHLTALELRGACMLAIGNNFGVITAAQPLSELHPGRERFHQQLMTALYLEGRQLEALNVYRRVARAFMGEFGVQPGRNLQEIHQRILRHEDVEPCPPVDSTARETGFGGLLSAPTHALSHV